MNDQPSLYVRLGGKDAVNAAVDIFYEKVLSDPQVNFFFEGVDIDRQRAKQKAFMTYAFGGAPNYSGASMRDAHAGAREKGLNESHFNVIAGHLVKTLNELNVPQDMIDEVVAIVGTTKNDVLGL